MKESQLEKVEKALGKDTVDEMQKKSFEELKSLVLQAEQAMVEAKEELEANPKYQEFKDSIAALRGSMRDLNKRQKAIIQYALHLIGDSGK